MREHRDHKESVPKWQVARWAPSLEPGIDGEEQEHLLIAKSVSIAVSNKVDHSFTLPLAHLTELLLQFEKGCTLPVRRREERGERARIHFLSSVRITLKLQVCKSSLLASVTRGSHRPWGEDNSVKRVVDRLLPKKVVDWTLHMRCRG